MNYSIIVVLLLIVTEQIIAIVQVEFVNYYSLKKLYISIGNETVFSLINLDINAQFNWLSLTKDNQYPTSSSRVINQDIKMEIHNETKHVIEIEDSYTFKNKHMSTLGILRFYYFTSKAEESTGALALPYVFNDESHSIIHSLKKNNIIDHLSFSIVNDGSDALLTFGGIEEKETSNRTHSYCDVIEIKGRWECYITKVQLNSKINNTVYTLVSYDEDMQYADYAYFDSASYLIIAPMKTFKFLVQYYNSTMSSSMGSTYKWCTVHKRKRFDKLFCDKNSVLLMFNITITIGEFDYTLDSERFWECYAFNCQLLIVGNTLNDDWILGWPFYSQWNILFNYEDKRVHIYSNEGVTNTMNSSSLSKHKLSSNEENPIRLMIIIDVILLFIGLILCLKLKLTIT